MQKYAALIAVQTLYRVFAALIGVFGVGLGVLVALSPSFEINPVTFEVTRGSLMIGQGIGIAFGSIITATGLFAFASLIQLLLDMAADMRATADYFRRQPQQQRQRRPMQSTDAGEWDLPLPRPNTKP